jgi:hypothetical protein
VPGVLAATGGSGSDRSGERDRGAPRPARLDERRGATGRHRATGATRRIARRATGVRSARRKRAFAARSPLSDAIASAPNLRAFTPRPVLAELIKIPTYAIALDPVRIGGATPLVSPGSSGRRVSIRTSVSGPDDGHGGASGVRQPIVVR